jgi:hypothetical protein
MLQFNIKTLPWAIQSTASLSQKMMKATIPVAGTETVADDMSNSARGRH